MLTIAYPTSSPPCLLRIHIVAATEALDPENPSEDMKQLLKDGRAHLEKLARGKENIEEWKTKAQEFYKLWVAGTKAKMRVKEAKPEVDKDIYGWTKFFRKEPDTTTTATATTATTPAGSTPAKPAGTSGSLSLGNRLGDRLAEKLRAARESKLQMGAASKPVTEKGSSLAEKLFGAPKPATSAVGAEGAAPTPKQSLTESLLAAVSKQAGPAPTPAIEEDASSLLPSDTIDEATWKNLAEQWERWTQPLFPSYGNQRITIDSFVSNFFSFFFFSFLFLFFNPLTSLRVGNWEGKIRGMGKREDGISTRN